MSIHILREARKSLDRGVNLGATRRCTNDIEYRRSSKSDSMIKALRSSNINCSVKKFGEIVGNSDKSLFGFMRRGKTEKVDQLIHIYKEKMVMDRLAFEGICLSDFAFFLGKRISDVWNENDSSELDRLINEYKQIARTCISGI